MTAITEDVKSTNFADLTKYNQVHPFDGEGGEPRLETSGPDLVTVEETKKKVERNIHEQESFWSWFCFRVCCCDGHCYRPDCYWLGHGGGADVSFCCCWNCEDCCGGCETCCCDGGDVCVGGDCGAVDCSCTC